MRVLGIETSCDETGVALYDSEIGLLAHCLSSQVSLHERYGGVVPELASRDHVVKLMPLVRQVLVDAELEKTDIDAVAYTAGPGLMGALFVGAMMGRSIAYGLGVPAIAVHHMEGHMLAPMLESNPPDYPFLALLVSGGHTQLLHVKGFADYEMLGESLDDAAGEAFDKAAKMLGLGYPGGPAVASLARNGRIGRFRFPRPMTDRPGLDFSFSGLKTFCLNTLTELNQADSVDDQTRADVAAAFEQAVADTLVIKCRRALEQTGLERLVIAGGVSANQTLRSKLTHMMAERQGKLFYPRAEFCTDNGAMIAYAGYPRMQHEGSAPLAVRVHPRWPLPA